MTNDLKSCNFSATELNFLYKENFMLSTIKTHFHNALTHVMQFVYTHRSRYETSFEKEASIAKLTPFFQNASRR